MTNNHKLTPVEWLVEQFPIRMQNYIQRDLNIAKQMELDRRKEDFKIGYNQGYMDAQVNHINDADNAANEYDYLQNPS